MFDLRATVAIASILVMVGLHGCGGGGGDAPGAGSTPPPATVTPTPIPTPPPAVTGSVVNTVPTSGRHVAPKLVFNGAGVGLAVWESADTSIDSTSYPGRAIWYSLHKDGQWSKEALLQSLPDAGTVSGGNLGYFKMQVAASASGFAVAWLQSDRTNDKTTVYRSRIYARTFDGSSWSAATAIDTDLVTSASPPAIASNGSGYLVAWPQYNSTSGKFVISGSFFSGGGWQGAGEVASSSNALSNPRLASNGAGYAVSWQETALGVTWNNARSYFNGSWGVVNSLTGLAGSPSVPYLASSGSGYLLLWSQGGVGYESVGSADWSAAASVSFNQIQGLAATGSDYGAVYTCGGTEASVCARVRTGGGWGAEIAVENMTGSRAMKPVLASDGAGYGVLWRQYDSSTDDYDVYYTTFTSSGPQPALLVSATKSPYEGSMPPTTIPREAIAYDGSGYTLGWIQHDSTANREVVYAQHYAGAVPAARRSLLQRTHDAGTGNPTLTVNDAGVKLATWQQSYFETDTTSGAAEYRSGLFAAVQQNGAWGAPMLVSTFGTNAQVVTNGTSFVITYAAPTQVFARIYGNGTLGAEQVLYTGPGSTYDVQVATDRTGYLVAWWQSGTTNYQLFVNRHDGSAWSGPVSIGDAGVYGQPQVASNGSGYAVAWKHFDGVANSLYANVFDGTAWGGTRSLEASAANASKPRIASNGSAYAVTWRQSDGSFESVFASLYDGSNWSAPLDIDGQNVGAFYPEIAANGSGYAVAWMQGGNCHARLWTGGSWGGVTNVGACVDATTNDEVNLKMASDGDGYAFAFRSVNSAYTPYGMYAAVYTAGAWQPVTGVMAQGCAGSTEGAWRLRGGSGGYGFLTTCNGGLYSDHELFGNFFRNGAWGGPFKVESGNYGVRYFSDLATDGPTFSAIWAQAHESQTDDPIAHWLYLRSGL